MPFQDFTPILSVVIPAYNEAERILPYLRNIITYLERQEHAYEVLVVDDGSLDGTADRVRQVREKAPAVRLIQLPTNTGKGAAVRMGMLEARGDLRLLADADGATPIDEYERLDSLIRHGADIAIGSRFLASRDKRFQVTARWHRTVLGNLFNGMVQRLGISDITDTQCGFKLLRGTIARDLFSVARINGYGFDLELLYIAQRRGYRIGEVPINWHNQPGSKVHVLRDGLQMIRDLFAVRHHYRQGRYARMEADGVPLITTSRQPQAFT